MPFHIRLFISLGLILFCIALTSGMAWGRLGLLEHCDFSINQLHLPPEDFQFYSDWLNPPSWITYRGQSIASHPATRHFWLFLQVGSEGLDEVLLQAGELRQDLEEILSRAGHPEDQELRILLTQDVLDHFGQDVEAKGGYLEVLVVYHPQIPNPNPVADFKLAYPDALYFYLLVVYNLEMSGATDMIWSDFLVTTFLSSFTARAGHGMVTLEWTTESERENLGFHVLRREALQDHFETITNRLIPSAVGGNSPSPQQYQYIDRDVIPGVTCEYRLQDINFQGYRTVHGLVTATPLSGDMLPEKFCLLQNYPNPFNATTKICYQMPARAQVALRIYDVRGELIRVLVDETQEAGEHTICWDGRTWSDRPAGSGLYFCSLQAGGYYKMMKMVLLR